MKISKAFKWFFFQANKNPLSFLFKEEKEKKWTRIVWVPSGEEEGESWKTVGWSFISGCRSHTTGSVWPWWPCVAVSWCRKKLWPPCYCLQEERHTHTSTGGKKHQLWQLKKKKKNLDANVNCAPVTREREVYLDLGWLAEGSRELETAESVRD